MRCRFFDLDEDNAEHRRIRMQGGRPTRVARANLTRLELPKFAGITAFMQPIKELSSGRVVGFEALARLRDGNRLLAPEHFLPGLSDAGRVALFFEMLHQANHFVTSAREEHPELFVSINVETSILMREDIPHLVEASSASGYIAGTIYLELLEHERVADFDKAVMTLTRLRALNIGMALDDIGSAYSSLIMLKRLPIDLIKLDPAFALELPRSPSNLQFVHSLVSLARGLGKKLVVEGVETPEIQDALTVLGVDYGQGYAIAAPMPAEAALAWLKRHPAVKGSRMPNSLLGCYASHLTATESCRMVGVQPMLIDWHRNAGDAQVCEIGAYFDRLGLHDTPYGLAHKAFHDVIGGRRSGARTWARAAELFRSELQTAIRAFDPHAVVPATGHPGSGAAGGSLAPKRSMVGPAAEARASAASVGKAALAADLFIQIAESANDAIVVTTASLEPPHPLIVYVNPAFTRLTGYSAAEAIGRSPRMLQGSDTDRATLDTIRAALLSGRDVHEKVLNFGKGGERYWLDLRIVPLRDGDGKITHFAAIERDVTMDKRRFDELELIADRDALTGIPNRRALLRVIESEITAMRSRSLGRPDRREACLAFFDVDHFKSVNDVHGHSVGDAVLLGMSDRLTENLRRSDSLGRMGGEEFALWMPGVKLSDAKTLVDRLRRTVADEPFDTPAGPIAISVSVGVTAFRPIDNVVHLMNRADRAMYSAKQAGRNRVMAVAGS